MTPDSDTCQRWRDGRHSWRHRSDGGFDKARYDVALIADDTLAKQFVTRHHYSSSYGAAIHRVGLFDQGTLVGVAVYSSPMSAKVLTGSFPHLDPYTEAVELGRFVLLDEVPANAETFFLAHSFRIIRELGVRGVVSFADPYPRVAEDGTVVSPGHVGTIYQAANGYHAAQRSTPRTLHVDRAGRVVSARALQKIRKQEQGHEYAERQLVRAGAHAPRAGEDMRAWLRQALTDAGYQRVRHPGNYRYLFAVGRRNERSRSTFGFPSAPYPKEYAE